jgi:dipeptidyl-peptidase-4
LLESANKYDEYTIGSAEIKTIKAADGTTDLHTRLIKPSTFDPSKKYPVLVYVYGGPHAQMITNSFLDGANLWMYWMAEQGYLVFTVDNRGSDNRGFAFESVIHRNLGVNEMDDQLKGVDYLKSLPYVDANRLAVHGWSYGGFMTTSLMLRKPDVFKVGVAGGPVTDWNYYEIMYGERYMDTPAENKEGFEQSSTLNYVKNLKGKLLLIHGTSDDVVVMQNNFSLIKKFVEAQKQVDFFPYPMHKHNVQGKDRVHLMKKVLDYVIENNK